MHTHTKSSFWPKKMCFFFVFPHLMQRHTQNDSDTSHFLSSCFHSFYINWKIRECIIKLPIRSFPHRHCTASLHFKLCNIFHRHMYSHILVIYMRLSSAVRRKMNKKIQHPSHCFNLPPKRCVIKYHVAAARKRHQGLNEIERFLDYVRLLCCFQSLKMTFLWLLHSQTMHLGLLHLVYCFTCVFSWTPSINRDCDHDDDVTGVGVKRMKMTVLRLGHIKWKVCCHFLRLGCHIHRTIS